MEVTFQTPQAEAGGASANVWIALVPGLVTDRGTRHFFPKLQEVDRMGQLRVKYPDINLTVLADHVSRMGQKLQGVKDFSRRLAAVGDREHDVGAGHEPTKRLNASAM